MSKNPFPLNDGFQHYYLYDKLTQPLAVVAIGPGTEEGKIIRGISVRSHLDRWDRIKGRKLAVGRCRKALAVKQTTDAVTASNPATAVFVDLYGTELAAGADFLAKSCFNVQPTGREVKILECLKKRQEAPAAEVASTPVP